MRIYPHLQDTGGFFVAVLERKKKKSAKSQRYVSLSYLFLPC
jgi:multisite-specific tRNA:(cytosine-C5)-methyltransferase